MKTITNNKTEIECLKKEYSKKTSSYRNYFKNNRPVPYGGKDDRNLKIFEEYLLTNKSLRQVADEFSLTQERVRQIFSKIRRIMTWHFKKERGSDLYLILDVRTANFLRTGGIRSIYQLRNLSDKEILKIKNIGPNTLKYIKNSL